MKRRPVLKPGDVCRLSKKAHSHLYPYGGGRRFSIVVVKVFGDGSDRKSLIQCSVSVPSRYGKGGFNKPFKKNFRRNQLWSTGYNIFEGEKPKTTLEQINSIVLPNIKSKTKGPHKCHCEDWRTNGCHCNGI